MKKIFIIATLLIVGSMAFAQTRMGIHAGLNLPMGDFGKYTSGSGSVAVWDDSKKGGAGTGFMAGLMGSTKLASVENLSIIYSVDFMYNGWCSDFKDDVEGNGEGSENNRDYDDDDYYPYYSYAKAEKGYGEEEEMEYTYSKYINVPALIGVNYKFPVKNNIAIFAEGALGMNFRMITSFGITQGSNEMTRNYDNATSFAFKIGAGFEFNDRFVLGVHYYSLGASKVKGETDYGEGKPEKFTYGKLSTATLAINLGIYF